MLGNVYVRDSYTVLYSHFDHVLQVCLTHHRYIYLLT
nr:MAG TPA_asm: hypothetical protein [Bacteriophage sp.]